MSRHKQGLVDANEIAFRVVQIALGDVQVEKNPVAVVSWRMGGLKDGRIRASRWNAEQKSGIARRAAIARWSKKSV